MPGKKKTSSACLGRNLIKSRVEAHLSKQKNSKRHTQDLGDGYDYAAFSVTEENNLTKFFLNAEMNNKKFQTERQNVTIVDSETVGILTDEAMNEMRRKHKENLKFLRCPRRPDWIGGMTGEELEKMEYDEFIEWRKKLAELSEEKGIVMTPFEKNLEFWRQFWRVLERSDLIVQILDARNPLMFFCEDIHIYSKEISPHKENVVLLNKSDFLTDEQRKYWTDYFDSIGITALFFSALMETNIQKIELKTLREEEENLSASDYDSENDKVESSNDESEPESSNNVDELSKKIEDGLNVDEGSDIKSYDFYKGKLLNRKELVDAFKILHTKPETRNKKDYLTIGLVGYPNVGKSSTINALLKYKKVSISATPGKTKHFQTIFLDQETCLCDCPGLVFPNFVLSKAEMIINGILPIDQIKDYKPSVNLLTSIIPKKFLQTKYSLILPTNQEFQNKEYLKSDELLNAYALMKGYVTGRGLPDHAKSAKCLIKDFVSGFLLYCYAPPNVNQKLYQPFDNCEIKFLPKVFTPMQKRVFKEELAKETFDDIYFNRNLPNVQCKGINGIPNNLNNNTVETNKPWKEMNKLKRNKREKLRRVFRHLDEH